MHERLTRRIVEDRLGNLNRVVRAISQEWEEKLAPYAHIPSGVKNKFDTNSELRKKLLAAGGFKTAAGISLIAEILSVSVDEISVYLELKKDRAAALSTAIDAPALKEEWRQLLETAPLREITMASFPRGISTPFIVLYTTDWCLSCQLVKPTFAELSFDYTKSPLFYSTDNELMKRDRVGFIPQLVAYFPGGQVVYSECAETTKELWEEMNLLITLGQETVGRGRLNCSEETCEITPEK